MKRLAALAAAVLLVLTLTVAPLAADDPVVDGAHIYVAVPGSIPCEAAQTDGRLSETVEPGSTIYFVVSGATRAEDLAERYARVFFSEADEAGAKRVGMPSVEYRMLYDAAGTRQAGYSYVIALPVLAVEDDQLYTVRGRVGFSRMQSDSFEFTFYVQENSGRADARLILCGGSDCTTDFSMDAAYTRFSFSDLAEFTVDVSGQSPVNVGVSFQTFTDVAWAYPSASLRCIEWRFSPVFNRAGVLALSAVDGSYLYEARRTGFVDLSDTYSESAGAFLVTTRRLGSYVISDRPLGAPENTSLPQNPPTGAFYA